VLLRHDAAEGPRAPAARWLGRSALAAICLSLALIIAVGLEGRSAAVSALPSAGGWPPYFFNARIAPAWTSLQIWAAVLPGGLGLTAGLIAVRRGWRPRPRLLVIGSVIAVTVLTVLPPIGSTDMFDYAIYGRIAALGHSPYVMTPAQLRASGDPVGKIAPHPWEYDPSVYGPLGTATEWAAAKLAGASAARTIFWLKVWNALAFLAVALALDWMFRRDATGRARAHLLWSVNPLMLFAVVAGGHIDGLGAALGLFALIAARRLNVGRGLLAGVLVGAAIAIKAPFALFAAGLGWAARRSPLTLAAIGTGAAAVLVPSYLLAGPKAISAVAGRAAGQSDVYQPWQLLTRLLGWQNSGRGLDILALSASAALAVVLLLRMPAGPARMASVRPALALSLGWLIFSPQQRPWFDAMIFPLLALMPATRLDWIAVLRLTAATLAELPGVTYYIYLHPASLFSTANAIDRWIVPGALIVALIGLLWLCFTNRWTPGAEPGGSTGADQGPPGAGRSASSARQAAGRLLPGRQPGI
jgi:hypothetical protein